MGGIGTRLWRAVAAASVACAACAAGAQETAQVSPEFIRMLESGPKGSLAVRATQGTKSRATPANAEIEVELFHRGQSVRRIDAQLDENGVVVIGDIPVGIGVRPLVRIQFAGVTYQEFGPAMDAQNPNGAIDVTVYDVTEEEPEWRVVMRHVVTSPSAQSVVVSETVVVENMGDRTWLGGEPDERGNRTAVRLTLPDGAAKVSLDAGFHGWCCTVFGDGVLGVQMPLMPERVTYRYSYEVPVGGGSARLEFAAPVVTSLLSVFVPENAAEAAPEGLAPGGMQAGEFGMMRMFEGQQVAGGQRAGLTLSGMFAAATQVVPVAEESSSGGMARILAGVGLAALVVVAGAVVVMRKPKAGAG